MVPLDFPVAWRLFSDVPCNAKTSLDVCAPYPFGAWCSDLPGCKHPQMVLHTRDDGVPLPPLHVASNVQRHGPFARCFGARTGPLDLLFVGDSQTKMLLFELLRWLDGGVREPEWKMTQSGPLKASILARAHYNLSRVGAVFVGGLYSRGRKDSTNLTHTAASLREAASNGASKRAVIIVGAGIWDLVHSSEDDIVGFFGVRFAWLLQEVVRAASSYAVADVVVRNVFVSYTADEQPALVPGLVDLNAEIARRFAQAASALPPTVRLHFVDAYQLSWPRRGELPFQGDGLHWACTSEHKGGSGCREQLQENSTTRPDEVGWAALQLSLLFACSPRAAEQPFGDWVRSFAVRFYGRGVNLAL